MLAEIYLLKLEAAVRAAKEAATTPERPNPAFHRVLAICPPQRGAPPGFRTFTPFPVITKACSVYPSFNGAMCPLRNFRECLTGAA